MCCRLVVVLLGDGCCLLSYVVGSPLRLSCSLCVVRCVLSVVRCLLCVVRCVLFVVRCVLCVVRCACLLPIVARLFVLLFIICSVSL